MYTMLSSILIAVAQTTSPSPAVEDIVVVGTRAQDALVECIARRCPPAEELEASLQASVEQFSAGRYDAAKGTLHRAIRRNRKYAGELPGPVSSLYATLSTVAEHVGDKELWSGAARTNVALLRQHMGRSAPETLIEEIGFANALVDTGSIRTAERTLVNAQQRALAAGYKEIAATAVFQRAWLMLRERRDAHAIRFANEAVQIAGPADQETARMRDVLKSSIAQRKGEKAAFETLAARTPPSTGLRPVLIFSKRVDTSTGIGVSHGNIVFADVGYWIRPDGRTAGIEILETSQKGDWNRRIMQQVSERRYAPFHSANGDMGTFRIDRFTLRADINRTPNSRIKRRFGRVSAHIVDLTETEAMSAAQKRRMADAVAKTSS